MDLPIEKHFDSNFTDKQTLHSYLPYYEKLLRELLVRDSYLTICEVGVQRGGSVVGWLKLLPRAKVFGVDCVNSVNIFHPNYTELIMNAYDEDNLKRFPKDINFFVEDGSHAYSDLVFVVKNYPHLLSKNGILVIEDLPDAEWIPKFQKVLPEGFSLEHLDIRSERAGRFDNQLLIIRRN